MKTPEQDYLKNEIEKSKIKLDELKTEIAKAVIGQNTMVEKLLIGLLTGGHILLEGVPGLAKTLSVKTIAQTISAEFKRIQFTPDLLPADILGTLVYNQSTSNFTVRKGPIFTDIILADEINRAPSKVQSALLESMQEKQVTIGNNSYPLSPIFWVLATENPIEHEGTYPLPEAQVDRFMLKVKIDYPELHEEQKIIRQAIEHEKAEISSVLNIEDIQYLQNLVRQVYIDDSILDYITRIVTATRKPESYGLPAEWISFGASPRASIYLALAGKAEAFLQGRSFVKPEDVKAIAYDVLRHRVILSYEAEAEEKTPEEIIDRVFQAVKVP